MTGKGSAVGEKAHSGSIWGKRPVDPSRALSETHQRCDGSACQSVDVCAWRRRGLLQRVDFPFGTRPC